MAVRTLCGISGVGSGISTARLGCWSFTSKRPKLIASKMRRWIAFIRRSAFARLSPHARCNQTMIVQTKVTKTLREWLKPVCKYEQGLINNKIFTHCHYDHPPKDPDLLLCPYHDPHFRWPRPSSELVLTNKIKNQKSSYIWRVSTALLHWWPAHSLEHDVSSAVAIGSPFLADALHHQEKAFGSRAPIVNSHTT